jgi:uncharacterized protein (DUF2249 family)
MRSDQSPSRRVTLRRGASRAYDSGLCRAHPGRLITFELHEACGGQDGNRNIFTLAATPCCTSSNAVGRIALMSASPLELDVRVIPPRDKHPAIFRTFDGLASGQAMVIVNDHDPRRLRAQFAAERPNAFDWTYEVEGPEVWRVRISRR